MKFTDAYWEITNLNTATAEVEVEKNDIFDTTFFIEIEQAFKYVVVKVPMRMSDFNFGLTSRGYSMTEVQCGLSKEYKDFDFDDRLITRLIPHISFGKIEDAESFEVLLKKITPGMFSTDRISLDPYYGFEIAARRYINWMCSAFASRTAQFLSLKYDKTDVGFSMYKQEGEFLQMLLGGIFEDFQSYGLGIMTPIRHFLYARQTGEPLKKVFTTISSNNVPVWRIYNHFNFKIDNLFYVFIKHIN